MQINLFKEAIVWTSSNCPACETVKKLLKENGYDLDIRNVSDFKNIIELKRIVPDVGTVPQVVIGGKYIGGLKQVQEYLNRK